MQLPPGGLGRRNLLRARRPPLIVGSFPVVRSSARTTVDAAHAQRSKKRVRRRRISDR